MKTSLTEMSDLGFVFYCSENNVWLTEKVPVEFLMELRD